MLEPDVLLGIDVGGTYTDAVAVRGGEVIATFKAPTAPDDAAHSLLAALDAVLSGISPQSVSRVSLSTTLITNLLAQGQAPEVALLLLPGPGIDPATYHLPGRVWTIGGAIDFRGREIEAVDRRGLDATLQEIYFSDYEHLAVVGKFSPRNPGHEQLVANMARQVKPSWRVLEGHCVAGQLNFPRRAAATALTLAVDAAYAAFFKQIQTALNRRGLLCPTVILKADGGTLPLDAAQSAPLESIFSGPAASVMGALALRPAAATSVVVDVGGTTTDLALILDGTPLFASRGATLEGFGLPIRAFAVRSLPLGGDSPLALREGRPTLLPLRAGKAACLGGPAPTLTDALRVLGQTQLGSLELAHASLATLGDPLSVAQAVTDLALARVEAAIVEMFAAWRQEPVYRLWELRQREVRRPDVLVGIGAAAEALVPALAERLDVRVLIPPYAGVANALGAALARTTYTLSLHADTERNRLEIAESGVLEPLPEGRMTLERVRALARERFVQRGRQLGVADPQSGLEEVLAEQFNVIQGWQTVGRIFDVRLERRCGLSATWLGEKSQ